MKKAVTFPIFEDFNSKFMPSLSQLKEIKNLGAIY